MGTVSVAIDDPDDLLLSALLAKLFADRQLVPSAQLIPYLVARIERSFEAAHRIVARLDEAALRERVPVNRALARTLLDTL